MCKYIHLSKALQKNIFLFALIAKKVLKKRKKKSSKIRNLSECESTKIFGYPLYFSSLLKRKILPFIYPNGSFPIPSMKSMQRFLREGQHRMPISPASNSNRALKPFSNPAKEWVKKYKLRKRSIQYRRPFFVIIEVISHACGNDFSSFQSCRCFWHFSSCPRPRRRSARYRTGLISTRGAFTTASQWV